MEMVLHMSSGEVYTYEDVPDDKKEILEAELKSKNKWMTVTSEFENKSYIRWFNKDNISMCEILAEDKK